MKLDICNKADHPNTKHICLLLELPATINLYNKE